ncbi:ribosomal protein L11 methyltransferase [Loigolactobacillus backii]|uniref:50S ribosomal protein L11 methyltransferase n=1 Tax=Loigolactobacillus backii TaxID=375175 RepID=UPI000C1C9CC4|nr:50S ribosomal protein L11 methyltransferase [Loigolactobacillus backii]PIO83531.1 ribosomal protein L11 methyltransferase [Loigolactobacillus backii]
MKWTEVTVKTSNEAVEAVANILMEAGATGVQINNAADFKPIGVGKHGEIFDPAKLPHIQSGAEVSAYYPETIFLPELLPTIKQRVQQLRQYGLDAGAGTLTTSAVDEGDWATAWKKYYHPVRVTRYLTVVPSWEKYQPQQAQEQVIRLDPGMAFGTGTHPTTKLTLEALEDKVRGGETMLDVGTGSGVLSIAAKLLGVKQVFAYDLDEVAVTSAKSNLALNPIAADVQVTANDLLQGIKQKANLIVANILAEIIVPLIPQVKPLLKANGYFIVSGIIVDKVAMIREAMTANGFVVRQQRNEGDWFALIVQLQEDDA